MSDEAFRAWAAEIDERPTYHSCPATWRITDAAEHRTRRFPRLEARKRRLVLLTWALAKEER